MEVVPTVAAVPGAQQFAYKIRECHDLPRIDCFRSLKHVWLTESCVGSCSRWLHRLKKWLAALIIIGIVHAYSVPFLPADIGRVAAFFGFAELPTLIASLISLRYDMIRLTMTTYEFWYFLYLSIAFSAGTIMNYQDTRALVIVPTIISGILITFHDANFRRLQFTIRVFGSVAVIQILVIVYVNFHLVDQWHTVQVLSYGKHAVTSDNIVTNYLVFTTILLLRNAYRKHRSLRDCRGAIVRCILYRCRVRLVSQNTPQSFKAMGPPDPRIAQLRLVPSDQIYSSGQIILRIFVSVARIRKCFGASRRNQLGLHCIGTIGFISTIAVLVDKPKYLDSDHKHRGYCGWLRTTTLTSVIASGLYCGLAFSLYQQQLFQMLLTSFDFLILAVNITLIHLCVSDVLAWTPKCIGLASSWMWIMWAISMDALTPDLRQTLGLYNRYVIAVIVTFTLLVLLFVAEIIFLQQWSLQDRSMFQVVTMGTTIHLRVLQIFFSCLLTSLPMCLRLSWRLYHALHGELILVQGSVEYEDMMLVQRQTEHGTGQKS